MNTYEDVLHWLYGLEAAKGMDFKLERVELALASLGDPHRDYPSLHIAGTNGKGSVAAICHSVLCAAGYRTGLYTSPHLVRFTERIRIGDREVPEAEIVALVAEIRAAATSRGIDLTFFEFVTVLALLYFARQHVEVAVIEVGLGGRLDATNVIDPIVAAVTNIGMDHTEWLGDSLPLIAAEKGGILKPGRFAIFGRLHPQAESVLQRMAAERHCPARQLERDFALAGSPAHYRGPDWRLDDLTLPFRGAHQVDNAAVALAVVEAASSTLPVRAADVRAGLAQARWPGRLEIMSSAPTLILDGAHNIDGARALAREIDCMAPGRKVRLLFAVMRDKDWRPMVQTLAEVVDEVVVTSVLPPRGADAAEVAAEFALLRPTTVAPEPSPALERLMAQSAPDDVIVVAGSLFLVGAVYPIAQRLQAGVSPSRAAEDVHG